VDHQARLLTSPQQPAGSARRSAKITRHNLRAPGGKAWSYLAVRLTALQRQGHLAVATASCGRHFFPAYQAVGKKTLAGKAVGNAGSSPWCSAPFFLSAWTGVGVVRREHADLGPAANVRFRARRHREHLAARRWSWRSPDALQVIMVSFPGA
jgi:hypothetical protein